MVEPCTKVRKAISRWSDWNVDTMVAIAKAESNCRENARGDGNLTYSKNGRTYGYSIGALQVRILPGREWCETGDYYKCAHNIWKSQGYKGWSVYKSGKYKKYL